MSGRRNLVVFDTPEALIEAARRLSHVENLDAHTPYHMPGLIEILPLPPSPVRPVMLAAGAAGAAAMFGLQVYNSVWGYPMNSGGRPLYAWPAFGFTVFEVTVLTAAIAGFVAMLVAARLSRLHDPFFASARTEAASDDKFYLSVPVEEGPDRAELSALPGAVEVIEVTA